MASERHRSARDCAASGGRLGLTGRLDGATTKPRTLTLFSTDSTDMRVYFVKMWVPLVIGRDASARWTRLPILTTHLPPRRPIRRAGLPATGRCRSEVQQSALPADPLRLRPIIARPAHLASSRASVDLTGRGRGCCCCCSLGDVEGSGQDGGLQRGRPSRRALPWIHGGELRPRPLHPHPFLSVVMKPHEWSSIIHAH